MSHNIYSNQWLDQVFERKNKNYGAYDLRLHASENTSKGLLLAITFITVIVLTPFVMSIFKDEPLKPIDLDDHEFHLMDLPEMDLPKAIETIAAAPVLPKTNEMVKPEIVEDKKIVDDKKTNDLDNNNKIGNTVTGIGNANDTATGTGNSIGIAPVIDVDTTIYRGGIELMPEFPGGESAMMNFLMSRLKYPRQWADNNIKGTVYISFIVDKEGSVNTITTLRGISASKDFENEAKRVVAQMPKWKAGRQNGKNVSVYFTLPVSFSIQ